MKKIIRLIFEFIKEYSTYNYHSGKHYRKKNKIGEFEEQE